MIRRIFYDEEISTGNYKEVTISSRLGAAVMSSSALAAGIRQLRRTLAAQQTDEQSDEQLLLAFMGRRDDGAFAALVRRYGPMVLNICRRVLGHEQDAEDAFQATFLVLSRNAAALRNKTSLASFLYGIAYRTALKAKQSAARRRKHERQAVSRPPADPAAELSWREVRMLLDEEIARLPEIYRSVFILCSLEGLSREESARRLGLKEGTVSSRLTTARKRLGQRLARRGVELTAVLAATTLAVSPTSALPTGLMATTVKSVLDEKSLGAVSAKIAALADGAIPSALLSKIKIATIVWLTVSLLATAGAWTYRTLAIPQASEQPAESPAPYQPVAAKTAQTPPPENGDLVTVMGRVLDPDGKPVKGARLYVPFLREERGTTDADGRFRVRVPRWAPNHRWTEVLANWSTSLVARADGYGLAWADVPSQGQPGELTLRLVKDQPIHGRIVNTEGKPLTGVRVRVVEVVSMGKERLDKLLPGWKDSYNNAYWLARQDGTLALSESFLSTTTNRDGQFELRGVGEERLVQIQASGGGIAQDLLYIVTRPSFDPAPINKAVQQRFPQQGRGRGNPPQLYGATILYVAGPGRAIEGVIREAGTGKPVPGMTVAALVSMIDYAYALTDSQGRFRLDGLAKQQKYWIQTEPSGLGSWMGTAAIVPDAEGLRTLKVELTVARGVVVTGQVIDQATGKGVPSQVRSAPLPENKYCKKPGYDLYRYPEQNTPTDAHGRFRLVVVPGPSVLLVQASAVDRLGDGTPVNTFTQAEFSAEDRKYVSVRSDLSGGRLLRTANDKDVYLGHHHACMVLDLAQDAGPIHREVLLERGGTLTVHLEDGDGKPLTGCQAGGLTDQRWPTFALKEASCTVYALRANHPRQLAFVHPQRRLWGLLTLRGDEKEAITVRLKPTGSMTGRVLDAVGQPLAGVRVTIDIMGNEAARSVDTQLRWQRESIRTGADGRFRIDSVVPHLEHNFILTKSKTYLVIDPPFDLPKVQSAQTLDLGDMRTKPGG